VQVVKTRTINSPDGSEKIQQNSGFHYAYSSESNFSCIWDGQDLLNPSGARYKSLDWFPFMERYSWGIDDCKTSNLTDTLPEWHIPDSWRSGVQYAGVGMVQTTECNHWRATATPYSGNTSWMPGGPFSEKLDMSIDLWFSTEFDWPELIIQMIDLPNGTGKVILTTAIEGYSTTVDGSTSTICSPPATCDGKPTPAEYGSYCIAKPDAQAGQLGGAVGYACGELIRVGFDCGTDIPSGCQSDLHNKADFVFSTYLENKLGDCNFNGVAMISNPNAATPPCVNINGTHSLGEH
jgi:hypothetical protein